MTSATCFECDAPVRQEWRDYAFGYGVGEAATELTARVPVDVCTSCGACFLGPEAERRKHEAVCAHHGVLTPREVRSIRDRHGLSRAAFAQLTGLGEATLHRWEHGIFVQNLANDRYLRLLESADNIRVLAKLGSERDGSTHSWHPRFRVLENVDELRTEQPAFRLRAA